MSQRTHGKVSMKPASDLPDLSPFSDVTTALLLTVALLAALLAFHFFPGVDRAAAALFFDETACGSAKSAGSVCGFFPAGEMAPMRALRQFLQHLPAACAAGLAAAALTRLRMGEELWGPWALRVGAVFWTYVLSVGLIVNGIFKELWGRPRPVQTDIFGGPLPFVPAGEISAYCQSNCSFISGEAAASAWLICLVALLPRQYAGLRPFAFAVAAFVAVLTSGLRMSFGGHYLSDVVLASLATLVVFSLLAVAAVRFPRTQS
ncbi:hypothetical protein MesoLjLc_57300 [Mesorhizobium sp. L-8-10]|uniref:phosphatase PAP2 family protein n=1 Tax=Mesorhizobium sp. L-8-10 TaxID=2744523 RepID=UPI0019274232|nr:phosphatase PAP2 family protein [Mesorhizobium sp. L-8-10]BCH33800.1 hypothetical protein MesoLjLc_57300 [Mesorhizobium sp. L-8-10]